MKMTVEFFESLLKLDKKTQNLVLKKYLKVNYDFQRSGGRLHRLDEKCKNKNFWSFSLNEDIRLMLYKEANIFTAVYIDHHENAYKWANKKDVGWNCSKEILIDEDISIDEDDYLKKINYIKQINRTSILKRQDICNENLIQIGLNDEEAEEIMKINNEDEFLDYILKFDNAKKEALLKVAVGEALESCGDKNFDGNNLQNDKLKSELISLVKNELQEFKKMYLDKPEDSIKHIEKISETNNIVHNYIVAIEDSVLENVVRDKIHKREGPLYYSDIVTIKKLEYIGNDTEVIEDLRGIEHLRNLEEINFSNNKIMDLKPISTLKKLKSLILCNNKIRNITPLKELISLETLFLSFNSIEVINDLRELKNLTILDLQDNQIESIDALQGLVNIRDLILKDNKIIEVKCLRDLSKLEYLNLSNNIIESIHNLGILQDLYLMELDGNRLKNFDFLKNLNGLVGLTVYNNPIEDCYYIKKFNDKMLEHPHGIFNSVALLDIEFIKVLQEKLNSEYIYIENLNNIEELEANNRNITNIEGIQFLPNLKKLKLRNNNIEDIERLKLLHKLEVLDLTNNNIFDISPLETLTNLKKLGLKNNNISDIKPISGIKNLELLYLSQNKIENLELLKSISESIQKKDFTLPQQHENDKIIQLEKYMNKGNWDSMFYEYFIQGNAYSRKEFNPDLSWKCCYNISEASWGSNESDALERFVNNFSKTVFNNDSYFEDNFFIVCTVRETGRSKSNYKYSKVEPFFENNEDSYNKGIISRFVIRFKFSETETELNDNYNEFMQFVSNRGFKSDTLSKMQHLYMEQLDQIKSGNIFQDNLSLKRKSPKNISDTELVAFYAANAISYFKIFGNKVDQLSNTIKITMPRINNPYISLEREVDCLNNVGIILEWENYLYQRQMKKESTLAYLGYAFNEHREFVKKYKSIFQCNGMALLTTKDLHDDDMWYVLAEHEQKANELLESLNITLPDSYDSPIFFSRGVEGVYWAAGEETEDEFWEHED